MDVFLSIARKEEKKKVEKVEKVTVDKSSKERANREERKVKVKAKVLERKEKKSVVKTTMMEQTCGGKTMVLGGRTSLG